MKARLFGFSLLAASIAFAVTSCSHSKDNSSQLVSSFDVVQSVKSASKSYKMRIDNDTYFLTLSSSLQWPEKFGSYNIKVLQDSLEKVMFNDSVAGPIDDAIARWVCTVDDDVLAGAQIESIDSVPDATALNNYEMEVTGKMLEFNEETVTYDVTYYSYLGGAHGNTASHPFTYDLKRGVVLTVDNMFNAGSKDEILKQITTALSQEYNIPVDKLADAGIMVPIDHIGTPYVSNGMIVFRYNPYEIAPYSFGMIDASIPAGALARQLTPDVARLLGVQDLR